MKKIYLSLIFLSCFLMFAFPVIADVNPRSYEDVPAQDSASNNTIGDVIGSKTDTHDGDSIYSNVDELVDHLHSASKVYPTGAAGVTVTCGSGSSWDLGATVEVIPKNTITRPFDIHFINVEDLDADATYEIAIYNDITAEVGRARISSIGVPATTIFQSVPFQTPLLPANSSIEARVMSDSGNADTVTISLYYHEY